MDEPVIRRRTVMAGLVATTATPLLASATPAAAAGPAAAGSPDATAMPAVTFASPAAGSTGVPTDRVLTAYLSGPAAALPAVRLDGPRGPVDVDVAYQVGERAISVVPRHRLQPGRRYTLRVGDAPATEFVTRSSPREAETLARSATPTLTGRWLDEALQVRFRVSADGPVTLTVRTATGRVVARELPASRRSVSLAELDGELVGAVVTEISVTGPSMRLTDLRLVSDFGPHAELPTDTPVTGRPLPADRLADIRKIADVVLAHQKPDGGLSLGGAAPHDLRLETYFNNYAAYSLYLAADLTRDDRYADAADRWLRWYARWMHPDGTIEHFTGTYPDWVRGVLDAQDSCPATYFLAVWKGATRLRDRRARTAYLAEFMPAVHQTYQAIDEVYLTEGVTLAKRTYPIRYLQDNAETWFGMVAYAKLCRLTGSPHLARIAERRAARTKYALRERFTLHDTGWTAWVVPPVGNNARMELWYPDAHAAIMMLAIIGEPTRADRDLWHRVVERFDVNEAPGRPEGFSASTIYVWWALAGLRVGDPAGAEHFRQLSYAAAAPGDLAMLNQACGHLIRVLAYPAVRTLWF